MPGVPERDVAQESGIGFSFGTTDSIANSPLAEATAARPYVLAALFLNRGQIEGIRTPPSQKELGPPRGIWRPHRLRQASVH